MTARAERERPDGYDKQPKRFKDYVAALESEITSLKKALPSAQPTRVRIADHSARHDGRPEQHLPTDSRIEFRIDEDEARPNESRWISAKLADSPHGRALELHADWDGLVIYPATSNVVFVGPGKRR
jgi:hypothetical protein